MLKKNNFNSSRSELNLFLLTLVCGNVSQIIFNDFGLNMLKEENGLEFVLAEFFNLNTTAAMLASAVDLMSFSVAELIVSTSEGMLH